ncbi:WHG domain-containing protein [Acanthopleuribacter pedis]|uniref:TetR/AcrR family transcriptional regulator n=1 Tax=Acanthopleuribacter pedis TaxID=442870 RepID=A0A8J7QI18_9BACT|nr:TetR/AcrR family transcriptional regulator [Acanthopleuribacter pedis]
MEKKAYHHGDLRAALLDAAETLLAEKGAAGLSLRAAAKRAGVSHTAPYRHFPNKAALLTAVAARGFVALAEGTAAAAAAFADDPARQLREAGRCYVVQSLANPARAMLMFGGNVPLDGEDPLFQEAGQRAFDGLQAIIAAGQRAGVFRDDPIRPLALTLWSSVHGLVMLLLADQIRDLPADEPQRVEEMVAWVTEVTLNGVRRRE